MNTLIGAGLSRVAIAQLSQRAENRFVGVNCGIMDQFASSMGRERQLIRIDCRDLSYQYVPLEREDLCLVLCDSQVRRSLTTSAYNLRRAQCEAGSRLPGMVTSGSNLTPHAGGPASTTAWANTSG